MSHFRSSIIEERRIYEKNCCWKIFAETTSVQEFAEATAVQEAASDYWVKVAGCPSRGLN
jgi:hypothetical protein